jgi:single-strand DNA-binding protein
MNSFTLTAIGRLTRDPELTVQGDTAIVRFQLVGYYKIREGREDGGPRESAPKLWFLAFGIIATHIGRYSHKGDQLIVEARIVHSSEVEHQREKQCGYSFLVTGFRFGTRSGNDGLPVACQCGKTPNTPKSGVAQANATT